MTCRWELSPLIIVDKIASHLYVQLWTSFFCSYFRLAGRTSNWVPSCNIWWLLYRCQNVRYWNAILNVAEYVQIQQFTSYIFSTMQSFSVALFVIVCEGTLKKDHLGDLLRPAWKKLLLSTSTICLYRLLSWEHFTWRIDCSQSGHSEI